MPPRVADDGSVTINLNEADTPAPAVEPLPRPAGPPYVDRVPLGPAPEAVPALADEGVDLEQQLRDMARREKAAADRATLERNQRLASEQHSQQVMAQTVVDKETSDYYSVVNALAAKTGEMNQMKADYATALRAGDIEQATEINDRMGDLRIDLRDLHAGKADFENKFEQRKRQPPPRPQPPQPQLAAAPDIETVLATMPNLLASEKDWARQHPDVVFDAEQYQQLMAAFKATEKRGLQRGSPEYFRFFNERLGYDDDDSYDDVGRGQAMTQQQPVPAPRRGPPAAAPVSRVAPGASTRQAAGDSDSRITLTTQQREAARFSRLDERAYARNVARLNDLKRRGYYQETG